MLPVPALEMPEPKNICHHKQQNDFDESKQTHSPSAFDVIHWG